MTAVRGRASQASDPAPDPIRRAVRHNAGVCIGLAPIGFVLGVTIGESSIDGPIGWAGGPLLASGAAHFALLAALGQGSTAVAAVATAVALSTRNALYSAALASRFRHQPRWFRWLGPYFLVDQLFAMVDEEHRAHPDPAHFRRYYLTIGVMLAGMWAVVVALGVAVGPVLPAALRVELMVVVLVVAMLWPSLVRGSDRVGAGVAAAVAVFASLLPLGSGLVVAALAGMAAAAVWERRA
ncbi:MAG TPA: AzlC family ABC transporter permease [Acidimicrobiia bacterium]